MGKKTGFTEYGRELPRKRPVAERVTDFGELYLPFTDEKIAEQTARCMDCGVPTCHAGCPLGNLIPDWNDSVYHGRWRDAAEQLLATNNFPEFTGRLCPAPCEEACVLNIDGNPVTIERIEKEIAERAFSRGLIQPRQPAAPTGKRVAVIGSGPAGLACAQQLCRAGHAVSVYERDDRIGGLLRYGIPDFKMEKWVIDRRVDLMAAEGVQFVTGVQAGVDLSAADLADQDAVVICIGTALPRDLPVPGRDLAGIHFAMEFLCRQNRRVAGDDLSKGDPEEITAAGKHVVVIGGGDTGSDCVGTGLRQGALSVTNFELLSKPPEGRPDDQPWPFWPMRLRTSTSHEEGGQRQWQILAKAFTGEQGRVKQVETVTVEWEAVDGGPLQLREVDGTGRSWQADLVLLAMGFLGPETATIVDQYGLALDDRGNILTGEDYMSSVPGVFAAGDARRGQSLVVWAISEGREAARAVDRYLMGESALPTKGAGDLPRVS